MATPETIVLTGSTGHLGSYLLSVLATSPERVKRIICLNRSGDAEERQIAQFVDHGLPKLADAPRVSYHTYSLSKPNLGLSKEVHDDIVSSVTEIVHSAWPVDWNKNFSTFESTVRGVSSLIEFALAAPRKPRFTFISSQAVAGNWGAVPGAQAEVPEREIDDWKVARFGYGQSKLVGERLLAEASRAHGLTVSICRIGQIAGPVALGSQGQKSCWPRQEWLPSLVISSKHLELLPGSLASLDSVDWAPVDMVAQVIFDLLLCSAQPAGSVQYNHIVNPCKIQWASLVPTIKHALGSGINVVSLREWVDALRHSVKGTSAAGIQQNPAMKLLQFFYQLNERAIHQPRAKAPTLDVRETQKRSHTLAKMEAVSDDWMSLWMRQWGYQSE